jgi:hypothetical protein
MEISIKFSVLLLLSLVQVKIFPLFLATFILCSSLIIGEIKVLYNVIIHQNCLIFS